MVNGTDNMPEAASRFMSSRLRDVLDLQGVPLRVYFRWVEAS
jgi:predicted GTPase